MSENIDKKERVSSINKTLLIVFIVLKLTNNIDWSWWWVLSPLWIPLAGILLIFTIAGILMALESGK